MATDRGSGVSLSTAERERLEALRSAETLAELVPLTGADDVEEAYFAAKREWAELRDAELPPATPSADLPGDSVGVGDHRFVVHGVTHADTDAERSFLREHVPEFLAAGHGVYCEQGVRPMYFADMDDVCAMDDYRWALSRTRDREVDSPIAEATAESHEFEEDVTDAAGRFREAAFSVIHSGEDVYGEEFAEAIGDVASAFLTGHEDAATGRDFEAFATSKRAARDPTRLGELQRYYKRTFLPQPLEREWLRRHDPELEAVSHARNERMADYVVFHADGEETVHLIVGAAHQPGVVYYLERHRDGLRDVVGFDLVE
jgi:hypothetical protein